MRAYMGIVVRHGDKKEAIPVVQSVLGIVQGYGAPVLDEKLRQLQTILSQTYEVRPIDLSSKDTIDDDVDSLWVVGPKTAFGEKELRAIDQFLMKGRSVGFFLDTVHVDARTFATEDAKHGLVDLLKAYGVELGDQLVADAAAASISVQERRGFMVVSQQVPYAFLPIVQQLEESSAISKGLGGVAFPFTTEVKAVAPAGALAESQGESRIVVAGSSSWLWDGYAQPPNLVLAANIADWLALDPALLAVRNRGFSGTALKAEVSDNVRNGVKFGNAFGVPLVLAGFGLVRWRMREGRRSRVEV